MTESLRQSPYQAEKDLRVVVDGRITGEGMSALRVLQRRLLGFGDAKQSVHWTPAHFSNHVLQAEVPFDLHSDLFKIKPHGACPRACAGSNRGGRVGGPPPHPLPERGGGAVGGGHPLLLHFYQFPKFTKTANKNQPKLSLSMQRSRCLQFRGERCLNFVAWNVHCLLIPSVGGCMSLS